MSEPRSGESKVPSPLALSERSESKGPSPLALSERSESKGPSPLALSERSESKGAFTAALALAALSLCAASSPAAADLPTGRLSAVGGVRAGTGGLADELGLGYVFGIEAGYQPMGPYQRLGWGASWSTLFSWYGDGSARVADQLAMVEMDLGLRARAALGARGRLVLHLGGGGAILRFNEPVVRDGDRHQVGPWASTGVEFDLGGFVCGVSLRYGTVIDGSGTIGLQLAVGRGS